MRLQEQAVTRFKPGFAGGLPADVAASASSLGRPSPMQNKLLAALGPDSFGRLQPHLELVPMPLGWAVHESGDLLKHAYFPTTSIVSLLYIMEDGASAAMAIAGNDGLVGISLFMSGGLTSNRAVVQTAGYGYRLKGSLVRSEFAMNGDFQRLALGYTQALITQTALTAVCSCHHVLDQKLCRLLLLNLDRLEGNEVMLTQELIAHNLGVRRESVTDAAFKLQTDGLIRYHRGRITILDRPALEERVCECYRTVKNESSRLIPQNRLAA